MLITLFSANFHFALFVIAALVFFAIGWLHLDSWRTHRRSYFALFTALGFLAVAASWLGIAVQNQPAVFELSITWIQIIGLVFILAGLINEPLLRPPSEERKSKSKKKKMNQFLFLTPAVLGGIILPIPIILLMIISILYFVKATYGYQKQLFLAAVGFAFLAIGSLFEIGNYLFADSNIVLYNQLFANYGIVWYLQRVLFAIGIFVLAGWTWSYLRFRFLSQLFITMTGAVVIIFLSTTLGFTWLLLNNLETNILDGLQTNINVFQYALEKTQLERLAVNDGLSSDRNLVETLETRNSDEISQIASNLMTANEASFLHIVDPEGEVIVRAEDSERKGDSVANQPVIATALGGKSQSSISIDQTLVDPQILIRAASPIYNQDENLIGVISSGYIIDNAFVDGIKNVTGLESSVYAGSQRVATTFVAEDGVTRYLGTEESNNDILESVLGQGQTYIGRSNTLNLPYYVAYVPVKNLKDETIGMISVGKVQTSLLSLVENSIQSTFAISNGILIVSIVPVYFFSKKIEEYLVV